jgi:hypothetical protein
MEKYVRAPIRICDGSAGLKSKQTDLQTVQTIRIFFSSAGNEFAVLRVVSSVLLKDFQINTMISCCRKRGRGAMGARGGGVAGNPWPAPDSNASERAYGRLGGDLSPGGGG